MTQEELKAIFDSKTGFEDTPPNNALLGLNIMAKYVDSETDVVASAGHDEIYGPDDEILLANGMTEEDAKELVRLGWNYDPSYGLSCFV